MCQDLSQVMELQWWTEDMRLPLQKLILNKAINKPTNLGGVECNEANKCVVWIGSDEQLWGSQEALDM